MKCWVVSHGTSRTVCFDSQQAWDKMESLVEKGAGSSAVIVEQHVDAEGYLSKQLERLAIGEQLIECAIILLAAKRETTSDLNDVLDVADRYDELLKAWKEVEEVLN